MNLLIQTLSIYGITGFKLWLALAGIFVVSVIIVFVILSIIMRIIRKIVRHQLDLVILQVQVPRYTGDEQQDKAPQSQDELAERIAIGEAFMASIAHLVSQKGIKPWIFSRTDYYSFEIVLLDGLIYFYVTCSRSMLDYMNEQIAAQYPSAVVEEVEDYNIFQPHGVIKGAELKFKKEYIYPIKTYRELESDALNGITSAMGKLPDEAGVAIQFLVRSAHPRWHNWGQKTASKANQGKKIYQAIRESRGLTLKPGHFFEGLSDFIGSVIATVWNQLLQGAMNENADSSKPDEHYSLTQKEQEIIKGIEDKAAKAGLETNLRVLVSANSEPVANAALDNIINTLLQFNIYEYGNALVKAKTSKKNLIENFIYREFTEKNQMILNAEEAATIFHFPQAHIETPNISWLQSRLAPPPTNISKEGMYLGDNLYRGKRTPIYIAEEDRRRHMYIIGMTGAGKSKFMDMMAIRDLHAGNGMCFIDPHGDDVDLILANVPKDRMDDVVYFDPSDYERPFGLNMLEYDFNKPEDKIFVVNQVFEIFDRLYDLAATGGPMFEQYMKNACMLIMDDPESGSTLMEVPRVLSDEDYRNYKLSKSRTPVVKDFWEKEATKAGGEASLQNMVPYITSKLTPFIANDLIRPIISQQKTTLDFVDAMNNKKIILVKLSKGKIGDINANLIGMIIIGKILQAAFTRADLPEDERQDFYLYIDEFQNFLTPSINTILSEARKYRLCLTMAHQFLGQLVVNNDEKIKNAIFGNVGTKIAFRIGVEDAEVMAEEFKPVFAQYDLMNVPKAKCLIKLLIDNANPPPFSMLIPWVPEYFDNIDEAFTNELRQMSKMKYGMDKADIEAELEARRKFGAKPDGDGDTGDKKKEVSLEDLFA